MLGTWYIVCALTSASDRMVQVNILGVDQRMLKKKKKQSRLMMILVSDGTSTRRYISWQSAVLPAFTQHANHYIITVYNMRTLCLWWTMSTHVPAYLPTYICRYVVRMYKVSTGYSVHTLGSVGVDLRVISANLATSEGRSVTTRYRNQ